MIVSVVNQKGGVGKTTLAVNLAGAFAETGSNVLLVDTDPQGSVLQWHSTNESSVFDVEHCPFALKKTHAKSYNRRYDQIVIDSPPALEAITRASLLVSSLAIVPITPSPLDIWSAKETVRMIEEAGKSNKPLETRLLVYRKVSGTRIGREAREALKHYGLKVFRTEITHRIAAVESMIAGLTVLQFAPRSAAAREIRDLRAEIG
jgi:chromosome partitioning protein